MQALDGHLVQLLLSGKVTYEEALLKCGNPKELEMRAQKALAQRGLPLPGQTTPRRPRALRQGSNGSRGVLFRAALSPLRMRAGRTVPDLRRAATSSPEEWA